MSADPSGAGRHRAVPGREADVVDVPALSRRRRDSARRDALAIASTALLPVAVAVALVVHNHAGAGGRAHRLLPGLPQGVLRRSAAARGVVAHGSW